MRKILFALSLCVLSFPACSDSTADKDKQSASFNSLLKNLNSPHSSEKRMANNDAMTTQEMDSLRYQLAKCLPLGKGMESMHIEIILGVNRDRTINSVQIADKDRYKNDRDFREQSDLIVQNLKDPKCTPLNFPPTKYDQWREITVVLDFRKLM